MASLQVSDLAELAITTLAKFHKPNYTALMTDLQDCPAAKMLLLQNKVRAESGDSISLPISMKPGESFANVSVSTPDTVSNVDGVVNATQDWRKSEVKYFIYDEEIAANREPSRLVNLLQLREARVMIDWIIGLEQNFWRFPSATDTVTPHGLPYAVFKSASEGFNGTNPTGYTAGCQNVSSTTWTRWANYTAQYTSVTQTDFGRKARKMRRLTRFKPLVATPEARGARKLGQYTNNALLQKLEEYVESRNDNLGMDIAFADDRVMLGRVPVDYVPQLDEDTTDPFYQLDWGTIKVICLADLWMKRRTISPYPGKRNATAVFIDSNYNFFYYDRRANGVMATGTSYP